MEFIDLKTQYNRYKDEIDDRMRRVLEHGKFIMGPEIAELEEAELARLLLAIKLFEVGRLTSGQAAQIAGLSRRRFLLEIPRYGIPSVSWDDEEIEAESRLDAVL